MKSSGGPLGREVWPVAVVVVLGSIGSIFATTSVNVAINLLTHELDTDRRHRAVDRVGLHARAGGLDLDDGVARAPRRRAAPVPRLARAVRRCLGAVRRGPDDRVADRLPRRPGRRRRRHDAGRDDDAGDRRRAGADGPRDERRRRADDPRADHRTDAGRDPDRRPVVALGLPDERAAGAGRARARPPAAAADAGARGGPLRPARLPADRLGRADRRLRARALRAARDDARPRRVGRGDPRRRADRGLRAARVADRAAAARRAAVAQPGLRRVRGGGVARERGAVRLDAAAAALLPGRPRRSRRRAPGC